ncbi:hypothetical protein KEM55_005009, partial [Ascosphaera atra]
WTKRNMGLFNKQEEHQHLPDISEVDTTINGIDFAKNNPELKWKVLRTQKRFALWGKYQIWP